MGEIETPAEFCKRHNLQMYSLSHGPMPQVIEARDAAVANQARLALLAELRTLAKTTKWIAADGVSKEAAWGRAFLAAAKELEAKYAPKGGG